MCETALIMIDDRCAAVIETVAGAKAAFTAGLVWEDFGERKTPPQDLECLCWLDMVATASMNGYEATNQHGGDPFEWEFRKTK